jgi:HEAT repeat protein
MPAKPKPKSLEKLLKILQSNDPDKRAEAAENLGLLAEEDETGCALMIEPLLNALHDEHSAVRKEVVCSLGRIAATYPKRSDVSRLHTELSRALDDEANDVGEEALIACTDAKVFSAAQPITLRLQNEAKVGRLNENTLAAVGALRLRTEEVFEALFSLLETSRPSWKILKTLLELVPCGPQRAKKVAGFLDNSDRVTRRFAAKVLGAMQEDASEHVNKLIVLIKDPEQEVRYAAIEALGCLKDTRALADLVEALRHPDKQLQELAMLSLGRMGALASSALSSMYQWAQAHPDYLALNNLARVGTAEAARMVASFTIKSKTVSCALGNMVNAHPAIVLPLLFELYRKTDPSEDSGLEEALNNIETAECLGVLLTLMQQPLAVNAAGESPLSSIYRSLLNRVPIEVAKLAEDQALQAADSTDVYVQAAACELLGKIGSTKAVPCLSAALHSADSTVRHSALSALILLAPCNLSALARPLMEDPDVLVRCAAGRALEVSPDTSNRVPQL